MATESTLTDYEGRGETLDHISNVINSGKPVIVAVVNPEGWEIDVGITLLGASLDDLTKMYETLRSLIREIAFRELADSIDKEMRS